MKLPAFQFYPGDWRKDVGVQSLDFHCRGVWFEILCLMHESERRGVLTLNGKAMPEEALARLLGISEDVLKSSLAVIEKYGVSSRESETGALMCRRMARDEEARGQNRAHGMTGGNPALTDKYNSPGFVYAIHRKSDGAIKIGIAVNVENRFKKIKYTLKGDIVTLMGYMATPDMGKAESDLHNQYKKNCIGGEWFKFTATEAECLIDTLKGKARASSSVSSSSSTSVPLTPPDGDVPADPPFDEPKKPKAQRARVPLLDALVSLNGEDPLQVTGPAWSRAAKALQQIKEVCAEVTPEEIRRRATNYSLKWPGKLTSTALAAHWAEYDKRPQMLNFTGAPIPPTRVHIAT